MHTCIDGTHLVGMRPIHTPNAYFEQQHCHAAHGTAALNLRWVRRTSSQLHDLWPNAPCMEALRVPFVLESLRSIAALSVRNGFLVGMHPIKQSIAKSKNVDTAGVLLVRLAVLESSQSMYSYFAC